MDRGRGILLARRRFGCRDQPRCLRKLLPAGDRVTVESLALTGPGVDLAGVTQVASPRALASIGIRIGDLRGKYSSLIFGRDPRIARRAKAFKRRTTCPRGRILVPGPTGAEPCPAARGHRLPPTSQRHGLGEPFHLSPRDVRAARDHRVEPGDDDQGSRAWAFALAALILAPMGSIPGMTFGGWHGPRDMASMT